MDNRPIGVFDSGLGGLTAVRRLREILPNETLVYLGDTLRVPYGDKSNDIIRKYIRDDINFLLKKDVKAILIACATATSSISKVDFEGTSVPVEGVLYPASAAAVRLTKNKKIGILATAATVRIGGYIRFIGELMPEAEVISVGCPKFVPLVESGRTEPEDFYVKAAVEEYVAPLKQAGVDTIILGCTHYPFLTDAIKEFFPEAKLVNAGAEGGEQIARVLQERDMLSEKASESEFYVSGDVDSFVKNGEKFLGFPITNAKKAVF
ncbi:MAG: glutamate racemase [Oscillospiraceae bacterium]|nr:glutamate racemase [Oscillospiraceae bacterium]